MPLATTHRHPLDTPSQTLLNRELAWLDLNNRVLDLAAAWHREQEDRPAILPRSEA